MLDTMPLVTDSERPERRTCRDDGLADLKLAGLGERDRVQIAYAVDLDHRQVIGLGGPDDLRLAVVPLWNVTVIVPCLPARLDHVVVGQDVAVLVKHHAAADVTAAVTAPRS